MATTAGQKWLIGCGIGCAALVLVLVMLSTGTCFFIKGFVEDFSEVEKSHDALVAALGEAEQFTPAPDGSIAAERIELFLVVREELAESREQLHELFRDFPPREGAGVLMFFKIVGGLAGMIDDIVSFVDARNKVLLAHQMGYGEYLYIYCTAFYSWLGHDPSDGPTHEGERFLDGDDGTFGVDATWRSYRKMMLNFLRNQLDALPPETDEGWRARLLAEIDALERDRGHVVWRDGLPPALRASLEPFRTRLEASYDAETNCFELPTHEGQAQQGLQWKID
jgi:hypothetical protein